MGWKWYDKVMLILASLTIIFCLATLVLIGIDIGTKL